MIGLRRCAGSPLGWPSGGRLRVVAGSSSVAPNRAAESRHRQPQRRGRAPSLTKATGEVVTRSPSRQASPGGSVAVTVGTRSNAGRTRGTVLRPFRMTPRGAIQQILDAADGLDLADAVAVDATGDLLAFSVNAAPTSWITCQTASRAPGLV